jgi:hypothetical protein
MFLIAGPDGHSPALFIHTQRSFGGFRLCRDDLGPHMTFTLTLGKFSHYYLVELARKQ